MAAIVTHALFADPTAVATAQAPSQPLALSKARHKS